MEIEKYSPKWLLEKINASKTDAHKLMHIIEYRKELVKSTEKQFAIHSVSEQSVLLMRDNLLKSREETARIRESTAIQQTLEIYCDLEELPTIKEVLERIGRKH